MKRIATLLLFLIILVTGVKAQEQPDTKQLADNLFQRYEYFNALKIYLRLAGKSSTDGFIVERVADCYRLMGDYNNAEIWYQKAIGYGEAAVIDHFYYAEILLRNEKFKQARDEYKVYYQSENHEQLPFKLASCDSAEKWKKNPSIAFTIKNEQKLNSKYSDWGLNYFGKTDMVFTSDRKISNNRKDTYYRNGDGYFNVYRTDGSMVTPFALKTKGSPFFDTKYHVGPMIFTNSGDTAYITITTTVPSKKLPTDVKTPDYTEKLYTRRLELIMATKVKGQWAAFKSFPYNNLTEYSVGNAALSKDGNIIYFTSDMPGGEGKTDIWYCVKQSDGTWDQPVNCGKMINTKDDESFPSISGNSLYFASNGLPGMGGLDIFKAKGNKATWSKPVNLKYPVNSTSDDFYFLTKDSLSGYFSSNREGGQGNDDIYSFGYVAPPEVIVDKKPGLTGKDINANLKVPSPQPVTALLTMKKGEGIILNNIYYDVNKADIRPDAAAELRRLAAVLKQRPSIRLEISSHTDSRAPSKYNMILSQRRAASAVAYLVRLGIDRRRLVPKGYGDTQLLNNCTKGEFCTEEQHQINRRTEVHIISE
ncbi:OmpA family protein [Mucilaginibacter sp. dw_454]|uniref:OmpA family protein n=1 Tax=Mucilaginibacter sp. dw_454 TaxID=2720079 RepID=UPI001BD5540B|nr:OmpA family protein [Mucilaginibacter sp. dw_454]